MPNLMPTLVITSLILFVAPARPLTTFCCISASIELRYATNPLYPKSAEIILHNTGSLDIKVDTYILPSRYPFTSQPLRSTQIAVGASEHISVGVLYEACAYGPSEQNISFVYGVGDFAYNAKRQAWQAHFSALIDEEKAQIGALVSRGPNVVDIDIEMRELDARYVAADRKLIDEVSKAAAEARELEEEKWDAVRELRSGMYCSKCRRPASQIERETGASFAAHLDDVNGTPEPASEEEVAKAIAEYDRKIEAALEKEQRARDRRAEARRNFEGNWAAAARRRGDREREWETSIQQVRKRIDQLNSESGAGLQEIEINAQQTKTLTAKMSTAPWCANVK